MSLQMDLVYDNGVYRTVEPYVPTESQKLKLTIEESKPTVKGTAEFPRAPASYYPCEDLPEFEEIDWVNPPGRPAGTILVQFVPGGPMPASVLPSEFFE